MNTLTKTIIAAVAAVLFTAAPAVANAERVYFLVGTRHVYRIGTYQYAHVEEREKIEQDYADQVAADQQTYTNAISGGADPNVEGPQLNQALNDLAVERDQKLGAIYENADYERARHPQLNIEGDGPYQVIGINFHMHASVEVFDDFIVYAPWPGYVVVDRPYGWNYGVVYTPGVFFNLYVGWHSSFYVSGGPVFFGFVGHYGPVGVIGISRGPGGGYFVPRGGVRVWNGGGYRYVTGASHFGGVSHVYSNSRTFSGHSFNSGTSRYSAPRNGGSFNGSRYNAPRTGGSFNTTHSTYSHTTTRTTTTRTGGSFNRPATTRTPSSYSHSTSGGTSRSFGSSRPSGSFSHSSSSSTRSSGSFSHSSAPRSSGSFSHSSAPRSSGSFSHSSSSRSFGSSSHSTSHSSSGGRRKG